MRRRFVWALAAVAAMLLLAGCSDADAADPDGRVSIGMQDNFFTRDVTRIAVGDTVRWNLTGDTVHNAVAVDGSWSTGQANRQDFLAVQEPGTRIDMVFDEPGVYPYWCTLHGTEDGEGMAAVLVVGDVEYSAAGDDAPTEPVTEWTGTTRRVPEDHPTIQNAVDAADPGDLVLIGPGVYKEAVSVTTPGLVIRGTDRNEVILDGELTRENGFAVTADGVAIENITARGYTVNGFFWNGVTGYRGSYLTAIDDWVYGLRLRLR